MWRTEEGLAVRPYYRKEALGGLDGQLRTAPGVYPFVRGSGRSWEIAQDAEPGPKAIRADLLHEAGAHAIQELGYGIAAGVERLAELTATLPADAIAAQIEFVFAVGPSYFIEIAKLRAARMLWAQVVTAFGATDDNACRMRLHVRTPRRNKSVYDRYTNLLRVTTEALCRGDRRLRPAYRRAFRVRCAPGPERPADPQGRVSPGRGGRSGGRLLLHRGADGFAGARRPGSCCSRWRPKAATPRRWLPARSGKPWRKRARPGTRPTPARRRALVGVNNYPNVTEKTPESEVSTAEHGSLLPQSASPSRSRRSVSARPNTRARPGDIPRCCCSSAATSR